MPARRKFLLMSLSAVVATPAIAQFTGPSAQGAPSTVADARNARIGTYVTLEGNIVERLREDYYTFSDGTDEIMVEVSPRTFAGQAVTPETRVRIVGEVDTGIAGRYIWVSSLQVI
jgi:uncharacterized protein (TIGR00156 family)